MNALTAQVARREATISAYETALTESHARIELLERERVGRAPGGPALQYLPLSEVTDGHVDAYLKATSRAMERSGLNGTPVLTDHDVIRAGLAAIQWPSQAIEPDPEMREVPWNLRREGDTVTATWVKDEPMSADAAAFRIAGNGAGWLKDPVVTRPVSALPDKPGAVIRCIAMRGKEVTDAREVVAELREHAWRDTDGWFYDSGDIVRVLDVLDNGRSAD